MTLGGDSRELSALYVLRQVALLRNTDQFFKIQGGMDRLPRAMAKALGGIVRYNAAVVRDRARRRDAVRARLSRERPAGDDHGEPRDSRRSRFRRSDGSRCAPPFSAAKAQAIDGAAVFPGDAFPAAVARPASGRTSGLQRIGPDRSAGGDLGLHVRSSGHRGMLGATVGGAMGTAVSAMARAGALNARSRRWSPRRFPACAPSSRRAASTAGRSTHGRVARSRSFTRAR